MDSAKRKEMKSAYKSSPAVGGICAIRCSGNHRVAIQSTRNIEGLRNRFSFAMATKGCPDPTLRDEWLKYGYESFSFEVLEELKQGETQTDREFADDLDLLCEMWLEKAGKGEV